MTKLAITSGGTGVAISNGYNGWGPTQAWLAEAVRTTATRLFAQAGLEGDETAKKGTVAVHRGGLTTQVHKVFGALIDQNAAEFSVSWIIDLLVYLEDLADVGSGYYLPRESRVVRLAQGWGRVAGGLPLDLSEHPEDGVELVEGESVGRIVKTAEDFDLQDQGTEHAEVFRWAGKTVDGLFAELCERLPGRAASARPLDATVYYNAGHLRARSRGERWQSKFPAGPFVVARTGSQPAHYSVQVQRVGEGGTAWFEVSREEARKWVLLAERFAKTTNRVFMRKEGSGVSFLLPDMLPRAWMAGLFACAATVIPAEKGWTLNVSGGATGLLANLLRSANIEFI